MRLDHVLCVPVDVEIFDRTLFGALCVREAVHIKELAFYLVIMPVISEKIMQQGALDERLFVYLEPQSVRELIGGVRDIIDVVIYGNVAVLDIVLHFLDFMMVSYLVCHFVKTPALLTAECHNGT